MPRKAKPKEIKPIWRNKLKTAMEYKKMSMSCKYIIVCDVETTGLNSSKDKIIQLSGIKYDKDFNEISRFDEYCNPYPAIVLPKITEITGITQEMVDNAEPVSVVISKFNQFSRECGFIAYNSTFDESFINNAFFTANIDRKITMFDAREMAYDMVSDVKDHKLITVCDAIHIIPDDANFHSSIFDVEMTGLLVKKFYKEYTNIVDNETCKSKAKVFSLNPWKMGKNSRVYVATSIGSFYYDTIKKIWGEKDGKFSEVDMCYIESQSITMAIKAGYSSLSNVKESVFYRDLQ